jgi:hypothetical protein
MRLRTLVLAVFWLGLLGYVAWTVVTLGAQYFQMQEVLESAAFEAGRRHREAAGGQPGADVTSYVAEVRNGIVRNAPRAGVVLEPQQVMVTSSSLGLKVQVSWSYPAVTWGGSGIVNIPLSIERTFEAHAR